MLALFLAQGAVSDDVRIASPSDFSEFLDSINAGRNYTGVTVYLDSDLSLPEITEPIGKNTTHYFDGVLDGQGHVISDLSFNSASTNYAGLFGYSEGTTIRNVVIDGSCSFTSSHATTDPFSYAYLGGIIGYCNGPLVVENCVNVAPITFVGNVTWYYVFLGGIVGDIHYVVKDDVSIINCANYGHIKHSGVSGYTYIGGIVGNIDNSMYKSIQNCLNYGAITHNDTTPTNLRIGGIAGYSYSVKITNCLNGGKMTHLNETRWIGSLVGWGSTNTNISYTYFTEDVGISVLNGTGKPNFDNTPNSSTSVSAAVNILNIQVKSNNSWNQWLLNPSGKTIKFTINNGKGFSVSSPAAIFPKPVIPSSLGFSGWYVDPYCTTFLGSYEVTEDTSLYGLTGVVISVTFNGNGCVLNQTLKKVSVNNPYGVLPEPTLEGYSFLGWFTQASGGTLVEPSTIVPSKPSHELYAHWGINSYTLRFDIGNGTVAESVLEFNAPVTYPSNVVREGYTFKGWDKTNVKTMPSSNLTITAQWVINNYTLSFDYGNGTIVSEIAHFKDAIVYPENVTWKGRIFIGWDNDAAEMPASNLVIKARWEKVGDSDNTGLIVGIVVPLFIIIVAAAIVFIILFLKKNNGGKGNGK